MLKYKRAKPPLMTYSVRPFKALARVLYVPTYAFLAVAIFLLGSAAFTSSNVSIQPLNRDIWQHAAALRSLIADLETPTNPFVISDEGSRHFHPLWVGWAAVAKTFGLSIWNVLSLAGYLSMILLGTGIFVFSKAYYPSPWAPLVLLLTMLFGWLAQVEHTGFHSFDTLLYGAAYPATYMIGFSLILWAITIRTLENKKYVLILALIVAVMFTTHQLGAAIGLVGAACFALFWPHASSTSRAITILATVLGLSLSLLWPYHNPLALVFESGNSAWDGGSDFYGLAYLTVPFIPSAVGLLGLQRSRSRPLALALLCYTCVFLVGLSGIKIAGRFLMPMTLVLHIGLASYILGLLGSPRIDKERKTVVVCAALIATVFMYYTSMAKSDGFGVWSREAGTNIYESAQELTRDIPSTQEVAVLGVSAWPVVATGQKVLSVPWPEPLIHDLAERQTATKELFDPRLPSERRIELAQSLGVRTLLVYEILLPADTLDVLREQSIDWKKSGSLIRFDLF